MQYTLRKIPRPVDQALRKRARALGKPLNQVAIEALAAGVGVDIAPRRRRSMRDLLGALSADPTLDAALEDQRRIDPELWR